MTGCTGSANNYNSSQCGLRRLREPIWSVPGVTDDFSFWIRCVLPGPYTPGSRRKMTSDDGGETSSFIRPGQTRFNPPSLAPPLLSVAARLWRQVPSVSAPNHQATSPADVDYWKKRCVRPLSSVCQLKLKAHIHVCASAISIVTSQTQDLRWDGLCFDNGFAFRLWRIWTGRRRFWLGEIFFPVHTNLWVICCGLKLNIKNIL